MENRQLPRKNSYKEVARNGRHSYLSTQLLFVLKFFVLGWFVFTVSRVFLVVIYQDRITGFDALYQIFLGGLRIDLATLCEIIALPILSLMVLSLTKFKGKVLSLVIRYWCWFFLVLLVLMEAVTPTFLAEYDARPNRLFFEYFSTPKEVVGMLMKGYWLQVILATCVVIALTYFSKRWMHVHSAYKSKFNPLGFFGLLILSAALLVGIRSGFQHRPINPAMVAFSQDSMVNTLPLNSTYSLLFAIYQMKNEASASKLYGSIDQQKMLELVQSTMPMNAKFLDDSIPTLHTIKPTQVYNHKNLIIVVEESLGAQFVGSLGGKPLTPNIDAWQTKSWFFTQLYATGTRSARGLEAVITGFLPSPARSVLKLPKAQNNFYTLAQTLGRLGYESSFIYGGESHFDNMKGFFLGNGFEKSIDQNDYPDPAFMGNWGVSDEDLFEHALSYLQESPQSPKFSVIFTSSNHTPFEFPDGKIELFDTEKQTVNNAVKYADYALGKFLDQLQENNILSHSVVLVVADHDARVKGESLVPLERFHIPGFIISPDVPAHQDDTLISQIDLAPTLLSLLGVEAANPMVGQDLSQLPDGYQGRAVMQYGNTQAYVFTDHAIVLQANKKPMVYGVEDMHLSDPIGSDHTQLGLAYAQFASWAYDQQKYVLNPEN